MPGARRTIGVLVLGMVAATMVAAGPASAATRDVRPGQSIQAAIDAANPGDTIVVHPGTYHENLQITKNNITLRGAGNFRGGTLLLPDPTPRETRCSALSDPEGGALNPNDFGICIVGVITPDFQVKSYVRNAHVSGFVIGNFGLMGIFVVGGQGTWIGHNKTYGNEEYGIFANTSTGTTITENIVSDGGEAGIYVGDSPNANATVTGNESYNSGWGVFLRNASHGTVAYNRLHDNCVGLLALAGAPGPVVGWDIHHNDIFHNNRACPEEEASGSGVLLAGTRGVRLHDNTVGNHAPSLRGVPAAGIGVGNFTGVAPVNNVIANNVAFGNRPLDVLYDRSGSGNTFPGNHCDRSDPASICA